MGYKLAGYDVIGGVEIDPEMMRIYRKNHSPRLSYLMPIQEFKTLPDLPKELFELDVLDGSPPCSSFSMAGNREKDWGKEKKFREGQAEQRLDDLFFHFIDLAKRLRPRMVVAENVKGLIQGSARGYVKEIFQKFREAGYETQLFLLNASRMGVPQIRERTFFIARRSDLRLPKVEMKFEEPVQTVGMVCRGIDPAGDLITGKETRKDWGFTNPGDGFGTAGGFNSHKKLSPDRPAFTQTATLRHYHWDQPRVISDALVKRIQSFPDDFDFCGQEVHYVCGMSVPPFMMQRVSSQLPVMRK